MRIRKSALTPFVLVLLLLGCGEPAHASRPTPHPSAPVSEATLPPTPPPTPTPDPTSLPHAPGLPVLSALPIAQPVVFITIDDGMVRTPQALSVYEQAHVPATLFLNDGPASAGADYFRQWVAAGAAIESHTATHPHLRRLTGTAQGQQICQNAATLDGLFGRRPTLFRPPFGEYDAATAGAAQTCGMHAMLLWRETADNGQITFQQGSQLRPGDLVVLHFRPALAQDLTAVLTRAKADGLGIGRLEDYL